MSTASTLPQIRPVRPARPPARRLRANASSSARIGREPVSGDNGCPVGRCRAILAGEHHSDLDPLLRREYLLASSEGRDLILAQGGDPIHTEGMAPDLHLSGNGLAGKIHRGIETIEPDRPLVTPHLHVHVDHVVVDDGRHRSSRR